MKWQKARVNVGEILLGDSSCGEKDEEIPGLNFNFHTIQRGVCGVTSDERNDILSLCNMLNCKAC